MRKFWHALILIPQLFWGNVAESPRKIEEESLFLRRIAAFWEEGEYQLAKIQMEEFLEAFPESSFANPLCAALGDLFLKEKNYSQSLTYYAKIKDPKIESSIFLNRMQCLYYLEWYATLADECETLLEQEETNEEKLLQTTYYLAIALYHQCLNAEKNPEMLEKLAKRAKPYFEILLKSQLDTEVAQAFAHLSCILKDYSKASSIYLDLAKKEGGLNEEMAFQAALIQAEYDKELAIKTFGEIAKEGKQRAKEAVFNRIVLLFDLGKYAELTREKETLLQQIPPEKTQSAHLFFGRSYLALKEFAEACLEFKQSIDDSAPMQTKLSALSSMIDAAFQASDLSSLEWGLQRLTALDPKNSEVAKGKLSKALLLKRELKIADARFELEKILQDFPDFSARTQASFELLHLDFQAKNWEKCKEECRSFLLQFPQSDLSLYAARYLILSLSQLAMENPNNPSFKEGLIQEIPKLISSLPSLPSSERLDWEFLIAKAKFELGLFQESISLLEWLFKQKIPFSQEANATLLLALCHRDGVKDLTRFCLLAENAIEKGCDSVPLEALHASLFNAYLALSKEESKWLDQAADHLWISFEKEGKIQTENLHWLADYYLNKNSIEKSSTFIERASSLLKRCLSRFDSSNEGILGAEPYLFKLANLYAQMGKIPESLTLAEKLMNHYRNEPTLLWKWEKQVALLQGENCAALGNVEKALQLFDSIVYDKSALRTPVGASAYLASARLRRGLGQTEKVLAQLKDLTIQKTLVNEPSHLEAALDYLDLVMQDQSKSPERRLFLLKRTKENFENSTDLLSKDYHAARLQFPDKDKIYQSYMKYLEAEILSAQSFFSNSPEPQKELQAKAKVLFLQIIDEKASPLPLVERARRQLEAVDIDHGVTSEQSE